MISRTALSIALVLALLCAGAILFWRQYGGELVEEPQMRLGIVAVPEQAPLTVAAAAGALDRSRVLVVEFYSLQDLHNAFLDGNVHACVFTLDEALGLVSPPTSARIEAFVGFSHSKLSLVAPRTTTSVAQLRGRRIGLEAGRRSMGALREMLQADGLTLGDVHLVQLDADSAPVLLAGGKVDAVLVYTPEDAILARAGEHAIASWLPPSPGEPLVLVANSRAHRIAAGQVAHVAAAWDAGVRALARPDSAMLAGIARRWELSPAQVALEMSSERWLDARAGRELLAPEGRATLDSAIARVRERWHALGTPDSVPDPATWLPARKRT